MHVHGWCSSCIHKVSAVHACAVSVQCTCAQGQCMHGHGQCSIHGLLSARVHTVVQHMHAPAQLSARACTAGAAWAAQCGAPVSQHKLSWGGQGLPSPSPANAASCPQCGAAGSASTGSSGRRSAPASVTWATAEPSAAVSLCPPVLLQGGNIDLPAGTPGAGLRVLQGPALLAQGPTCTCLCSQ